MASVTKGETFDFAFQAGAGMEVRSHGLSPLPAQELIVLEALLTSLGMVAIAEMGDKTQLLSFVLAARFRGQQWIIIAGIFVATLVNHLLAALLGDWAATKVNPTVLGWVLGLSFLGFAVWAIIPDKLDDAGDERRHGAFITTLILFFLAEMGDKTQLATIALGAKFSSIGMVSMGTTLGMLVANVPAVLLGEKLCQRIPLSKIRFVAAALFAIFGVLILANVIRGSSMMP
jgi:putative Ca2+/H+ antiporter (TMEM165/GDT1 family)